MMMGGFIGPITFEGDFEVFLPFLLPGEYLHVGKGTSFGLGKYEIFRNLCMVPSLPERDGGESNGGVLVKSAYRKKVCNLLINLDKRRAL